MTEEAEEKRRLRERMRRVRAAIPPAERGALGERIEENLFGVPGLARARMVLLFYSFGTEVPTAGLIERLLREGRRVLLPYLTDDGMEAAEIRPGELLVPTRYGPKEPSDRIAVDPGDVDAIITPGLAFDRRGYRLGYGRGYYDRYLARLTRTAFRVGIAYAVQLLEQIPGGPGDERVHVVVTEAGVTHCGESAPPGGALL